MTNRIQFYTFLFTLLALCLSSRAETDRYRLIIRDDPATSMCIGWDQESGQNPMVYYGTQDQAQNASAYEMQQKPDRIVSARSMNNHFVRLNKLKPATRYYFIIVDSEGSSDRFWFETLPDNPDTPLSLICGGDSRRNSPGNGSHEPRVSSNKLVAKLKPHAVAFGGDYTLMDSDKQWVTWFNDWQHTTDKSGRMTPIIPARGNHEKSNEVMVDLFDVADPGVYYAKNLGGNLLRIYTLNTLMPVAKSEQTKWLSKDLAAHKGKEIWRMAQYHHPIIPHQSGKPLQPHQYENWAGLFYDYQFKMVIECDAHVAKITYPIKPDPQGDKGFSRDPKGTVYLGEGSWGLTRKADVAMEWTHCAGSFTQFKWIILYKDKARIRTVKTKHHLFAEEVDLENRYEIPEGVHVWEMEGIREMVIYPN